MPDHPLAGDRIIGPAVSGRAILGCGSFGGIGSTLSTIGTGLDEAEAFAVMDAAHALGITIFDTADGYGGGASEQMIGRWLGERDHPGITVSSKVGVSGGTVHGRDLSPERITSHALESLQRLGLDRIDMYMVHASDPNTPVEESLAAFDALHRDGAIGALGMCNVTVETLEEWSNAADRLEAIRISWVQNEYSLMCRRDEAEVIPYCAENNLAYTGYSPLNGGILAGRYERDAPPPPNSRIAVLTAQYGPRLTDRVHDALDEFKREAAARQVSPSGLALGWVMNRPGVSAPIAAPRRPDQFGSVIEGAQLELSPSEQEVLAGLFD
jgi:aryl-alcohol dehydrogenase-like predicted oxidoreductase